MFCFETAVKCMYWSFLCYDESEGSHNGGGSPKGGGGSPKGGGGSIGGGPLDEAPDGPKAAGKLADADGSGPGTPTAAGSVGGSSSSSSPYNADTALLLYDLENYEVMWERSHDTRACIGWNDEKVRMHACRRHEAGDRCRRRRRRCLMLAASLSVEAEPGALSLRSCVAPCRL